MPAPKGNDFWKFVQTPGRPKKDVLTTPKKLWDAACKYFEWCEHTPMEEEKVFSTAKGIIYAVVDRKRPFTIQGLTNFIGITRHYWNTLRREKEASELPADKDFLQVMYTIEQVIFQQEFEGAAAGFFNPNIIARNLALKEHTDLSSEDGSMSPPTTIERVIVDPKATPKSNPKPKSRSKSK